MVKFFIQQSLMKVEWKVELRKIWCNCRCHVIASFLFSIFTSAFGYFPSATGSRGYSFGKWRSPVGRFRSNFPSNFSYNFPPDWRRQLDGKLNENLEVTSRSSFRPTFRSILVLSFQYHTIQLFIQQNWEKSWMESWTV